MTDSVQNNKRIAKNTLLLYVRMLFMMAVSLYTSRVVLNTLGVVDYGIYNVVGGVVAMFGFLNTSMATATQRYITFALGKGDYENLQKVFTTALQIHIFIAMLIILLGETIGLWFLYGQMQIPESRLSAAFGVFQFSILSTVVMIISVPYNADIIAHEKMSAFAYISILEVILKLVVVYLLLFVSFDKLILYALLIFVVQVLIRYCYGFYCNRHFPETRYKHVFDKALFHEMTTFAGWNIFGALAGIISSQGLNLLLNIFFGPVVNAARAVAVQVQSVVLQFVSNFQMAINPQITKTYACGDMDEMRNLMFRSARFTFYLLFLLTLPILFETEFILRLWLKNVPDNTIIFLRIIICISLISSIVNPLAIVNQATGHVKNYQVVCGGILLLILPLSYVGLKLGLPAYSVFIIHFFIEIIALFARMIMLRNLVGIKVKSYFKYIYNPILLVCILSCIMPSIIFVNMDATISRFLIVTVVCILFTGSTIYVIGLSQQERTFVRLKVINICKRIKENYICNK